MLPPHGFTFEHFTDIMSNSDKHWERFIHRVKTADEKLPALSRNVFISRELETLGIDDTQAQEVVKKSLLLLYSALGGEIVGKLFRYEIIETIISTFPMAVQSTTEGIDGRFREVDLQMSVLYASLERICRECGGKEPMKMMYALLNEIPLTYNKHLIILDMFQKHIQGHTCTFH